MRIRTRAKIVRRINLGVPAATTYRVVVLEIRRKGWGNYLYGDDEAAMASSGGGGGGGGQLCCSTTVCTV